jgi:hypothetical protein
MPSITVILALSKLLPIATHPGITLLAAAPLLDGPWMWRRGFRRG